MVEDLKKSGKKGTPVTEESFKAWQERKRKRRAEESKKLVEAEMRKKKGGKGLAVLSGRALYEYKRDLFKDEEEGTSLPSEAKDQPGTTTNGNGATADVNDVVAKVQENLFLEGGDDDDLDDLDDLDDE